ncbi:hypothetical protein NC652_035720 [Populus alba x Populus x berolinensis]|nr:hypothetical protein NC652_035720 [Populus alba x Populus x berolinensis]
MLPVINPQSQRQQQQLNLSVLRFTFVTLSLELFDKNFSSPQGIPGLDESYLPRWIGYGFGSLLILNHFLGSNPDTTQAQLRTEVLGLFFGCFLCCTSVLWKEICLDEMQNFKF